MDDGGIDFSLMLEKVETSRDSNWTRTSVTVSGGNLVLRRESGGPFPPEEDITTRALDAGEAEGILDLLRTCGLAANAEVREGADDPGVAGRLLVTVRGPAPSRVEAEGRVDAGDAGEWFRRAESFLLRLELRQRPPIR